VAWLRRTRRLDLINLFLLALFDDPFIFHGFHLFFPKTFLFNAPSFSIALAIHFLSAMVNLFYLLQSHFLRAKALRVGLPLSSFIAPGFPDILAQKLFLRAADFGDFLASAALTGGFKFIPWALADAPPFAFKPPSGFFPSLRCHAGVFI
jgi:hypothetical protein